MLKAMIEKIVELAAPRTFEWDGAVYSDKELKFVQDKKCRPMTIEVTGLDSISKLVRNEVVHVGQRLFIRVKSYREVEVFTTLDSDEELNEVYDLFMERLMEDEEE